MGRMWDLLHPRQAEAQRLEAERDRQRAVSLAAYKADVAYAEWAADEYHRGNPPESATLNQAVTWYADQYPEVSQADWRARGAWDEEQDEDPPEPVWDPGDEIDDQGGMSEINPMADEAARLEAEFYGFGSEAGA